MKIKNLFIISFFVCTVFSFFSCASIQKDVVMSTETFVQNQDVLDIEQRFTSLDAINIGTGEVADNPALFMQADDLIKSIETTIKASGVNPELIARLYALDGLTCLLQNKKQKAKLMYQTSLSTYKGDSYTVILGARLGLISSLEDKNVISGSNQTGLLKLEEGITYYINGEYSKSVAQLDSAFLSLPDFYKESYSLIRQKAWNLRGNADSTENAAILSILGKSQVTVGEMILVTQETTSYLNVVTGGNKYTENDLFTKLKNAGYFDPASSMNADKKNNVKKNQIVNRAFCARFLWNIYCEKKSIQSEKTKYSETFRVKKGFSPIPDVEIIDDDFDAILGTVENEIMSLPDGVNFMPTQAISASEFNSSLQKIK